ncbi:hypothetical protein STA1M1_30940 [Sinisalibacter aestuarii]|uniref:Cadherin domain-containing protein n=2 Tax=Sinisalibacter aestuarii TaxID=2949426 RepID=A0ABQ5LW50_9RHOB|nr:hypothetical protein STA1M1_30940 [Sinisalibacter aestuarii]
MFDQVNAGDTPAPGADPLAPIGIRTIDGSNNNISGLPLVDQFGNIVDPSTFGMVDHAFVNWSDSTSPLAYASTGPIVTDGSERLISNLVVDMTNNNPATDTAPLLTQGDRSVDRLPENSLFTFFGQFFDHGLDFISRGGDSLTIPTPDMPGPGVIPLNRGEVDANGNTINHTAPFVEQSQTYGSKATTTFYLMEYDMNGEATGELVHGVDGGMGTWADIKANALKWAQAQATAAGVTLPTEMLTDAHVLDVPDWTMWDVATGQFLPGAGTGQAFLADIAHFANPDGGKIADGDNVINTIPPAANEYDNELLDAHYVSGDPRVNENAALTAIHQAFHGEHTRILHMIEDWISQQNQLDPTFAAQWTGEMKFQATKLANEMQYQHLVFEEFGRRMSPNIDAFAQYDININPNITEEFSQAVYRLGHSQLTDTVKTMNTTGDVVDLTLVNAFLNPEMFNQFGAGDFLKGGQFEQGARIDEFVTDALRNFLVGLPLDLAAINIARGREVGLPSLNQLRADLFAQTGGEASLRPYESWADFGGNLLNEGSLVNFIAAYGTHATLDTARASGNTTAMRSAAQDLIDNDAAFMNEDAATSGVDNIDLWIGGLAEKKVPLGLLGSTFDFVFAQQMIALQNGDRFYYLARIGGNLLAEIEGQTLADLMMRSGDAVHLNGDVFGTPDDLVEMGATAAVDLLKTPTQANWYYSEILAGTHSDNVIEGGAGNDMIYGEGGNDTLFGGENDDHVYGGAGNDIIWGDAGFDKLRGDAGDDEIHGGADDDIINGNSGNDVLFGDAGFDEIFAGPGDDIVHGGAQDDGLLGQEGDDILYGDAGDDGLDGGDGDDILFGGFGVDRLQGFAGDDMLFGGAGADSFDGGVGGYDIANYEDWLADADPGIMTGVRLTINMLNPALSTGEALGDTFLDIEELRGTIWDDIIVGDDIGLILNGNAGNDRITGGLGIDTFIGGEGDDRLIGDGLGQDIALFRGSIDDFTFGSGLPGQTTVTDTAGTEGTDTLTGIEWAMFDDALLDISTGEFAPLVNLPNTVERVQNGTTIIGELQLDTNFVDGTPVPGVGTVVGDLDIIDSDGPNGAVTLGLLGPDAALFDIVPGGAGSSGNQLIFIGGGVGSFINYEAKQFYNVTVTAADASGGSEFNLKIVVDDVNDNAPVMVGASRVNVTEVTSPVAAIYYANSTDLDTTGEEITYTLGGVDAGAFNLSANGELHFADVPLFGAPVDTGGDNVYDVTITASDGVNSSEAKNVAIHVTDTANFVLVPGTPASETLLGSSADNHITGEGGNDRLFGKGGANWLEGGIGNDRLFGGGANDILSGGDNNDFLRGGGGADFIDGGNGIDRASWNASSEGVTVNLALGTGAGGSASGDLITNVEEMEGSDFADNLTGDDGDNWIAGRGGADTLAGGLGNDVIFGNAGSDNLLGGDNDDLLIGGAGADTLNGGTGQDRAEYVQSGAAVQVDLGSGVGTGGDAAGDILISIENVNGSNFADTLTGDGNANILRGRSGDDVLNGGAGDDVINGENGVDTINGGADDDVLYGGNDADTFVFDPNWGNDTIVDFEDGVDLLDFSAFAGLDFSGLTVVPSGSETTISITGDPLNTILVQGGATIDSSDFIFAI